MSAYRMLVCYRCRQRTPSYQMTVVIRPSNKRHYFCPACNARRAIVRVNPKDRPISEVWRR